MIANDSTKFRECHFASLCPPFQFLHTSHFFFQCLLSLGAGGINDVRLGPYLLLIFCIRGSHESLHSLLMRSFSDYGCVYRYKYRYIEGRLLMCRLNFNYQYICDCLHLSQSMQALGVSFVSLRLLRIALRCAENAFNLLNHSTTPFQKNVWGQDFTV